MDFFLSLRFYFEKVFAHISSPIVLIIYEILNKILLSSAVKLPRNDHFLLSRNDHLITNCSSIIFFSTKKPEILDTGDSWNTRYYWWKCVKELKAKSQIFFPRISIFWVHDWESVSVRKLGSLSNVLGPAFNPMECVASFPSKLF